MENICRTLSVKKNQVFVCKLAKKSCTDNEHKVKKHL